MSACPWKRPHFRLQANCIEYGIENTSALKINNIILENFEIYTKKTSSCHLYSSFWKHNPFGDVCDLKLYNFYSFLYCLHFSAADDAAYEKYDTRSIYDLSAFPLKRPLIIPSLQRARVGELVTQGSNHLVKHIVQAARTPQHLAKYSPQVTFAVHKLVLKHIYIYMHANSITKSFKPGGKAVESVFRNRFLVCGSFFCAVSWHTWVTLQVRLCWTKILGSALPAVICQMHWLSFHPSGVLSLILCGWMWMRWKKDPVVVGDGTPQLWQMGKQEWGNCLEESRTYKSLKF